MVQLIIMTDMPPSSPEVYSGTQKRKLSRSLATSTSGQDLGPLDDLTKNQWIPFASTAVVFLLMAIFVYVAGDLAIRSVVHDPLLSIDPIPTELPSSTIPLTPTEPPRPAIVVVTPTPVTPTPVTLRVLPITANVRATPSLTGKIIGQVKKDTIATPLARSNDDRWFLVISLENGVTGWVASELFEAIGGDPKTLPTVAPGSP